MHNNRKTLLFAIGLGLVTAASWCRADYSNTVMSFNPVAYWPLNETNQPPLAPTTATNLGTLGATGNGVYGGVPFAAPSALVGDTDKAASLSIATVTTPYSAKLT